MSVASTVLLIAGSPSGSSRSAALLDSVSLRLARSGGLKVERLNIRELPAQALLLAEWGYPESWPMCLRAGWSVTGCAGIRATSAHLQRHEYSFFDSCLRNISVR